MKFFAFVLSMFLAPTPDSIAQDSESGIDHCPRLAGRYHCPAGNGNGPFEMTVTQKGPLLGVVHYDWAYSEPFSPVKFSASVRGVKNPDGRYGVCRNRGLYITKDPNDLSKTIRNELDRKRNYKVTDAKGGILLYCVRFNEGV